MVHALLPSVTTHLRSSVTQPGRPPIRYWIISMLHCAAVYPSDFSFFTSICRAYGIQINNREFRAKVTFMCKSTERPFKIIFLLENLIVVHLVNFCAFYGTCWFFTLHIPIHNNLPLGLVMSQMNASHIRTPCSFKISCNIMGL